MILYKGERVCTRLIAESISDKFMLEAKQRQGARNDLNIPQKIGEPLDHHKNKNELFNHVEVLYRVEELQTAHKLAERLVKKLNNRLGPTITKTVTQKIGEAIDPDQIKPLVH